uniref:MFS_1_like domain-containing protein n=1 Tax=Haemonchus placei TaxID=6290 RepID=A0A0N4W2A5_HAEPC
LAIASVISLFTAIQFTIYFSSLWPYLLQLDPSATESFFGWITAVYSLGQAVMCVVFGYWQNRYGVWISMIRFTRVFTISIHTAGRLNVLKRTDFVLTGMVTVLRTYAVIASTESDRSRSISLSSGSFALGLTIGPGKWNGNMNPNFEEGPYRKRGKHADSVRSPAFMGLLVNLICFILVIFLFRESNVGLQKQAPMENGRHLRFFALPKYDRLALMICILTRFAQMFVITNIETLGAPISMTIFGWNKQETVKYNSLMHGGFGFIGFSIYAISTCSKENFMKLLQGTMQGVLLLSGSVARMCGPIFVANLFTEYGPRPAWGMEIAFAGVCALLWIIFYKRMVPLKLPKSFSAGEMFRNKHGMVYKF